MRVRRRSSECMFSFSECEVFWMRQKMTPVRRHCSSWLVFDPGVEQRSDVYHRLAGKLPLITSLGLNCRRLGKADILSCQHRLMYSYLHALTVYLGDYRFHGHLGGPDFSSFKSAVSFSRHFQAPLPSQGHGPAKESKGLCSGWLKRSSAVGEDCVHAETMCAWPGVVLDGREGKCLLACLTHMENCGQLESYLH